jgi:hypothetical protein
VAKGGTDIGTRPKVNFIEGSNVTITPADNAGSNRVDVTVASSSPTTALQGAYDNSGTPATITTTSATKDIVFKSGAGSDSATAFQVQSAGSTTPVFDVDTANGRVGIGTASPATNTKLDVNGIINIDLASTYRVGAVPIMSALTNHNVLWSRTASGGLRVYASAGATPLVQVTDAGNVGIGTTIPNSLLPISGSVSIKRTTVADANYTILSTDYLIVYTSLTTGRTVTLPTAVSITGREYIIKDEAGTAGTNNITVATTGGQTIDGAANKVINTNYGA